VLLTRWQLPMLGFPTEGAELAPSLGEILFTIEANPRIKHLRRMGTAHHALQSPAARGSHLDSVCGIVRSAREGISCCQPEKPWERLCKSSFVRHLVDSWGHSRLARASRRFCFGVTSRPKPRSVRSFSGSYRDWTRSFVAGAAWSYSPFPGNSARCPHPGASATL